MGIGMGIEIGIGIGMGSEIGIGMEMVSRTVLRNCVTSSGC
jgi:hypothetical protein